VSVQTSAIRDEAARWVARMDAETWSAEDERALELWLSGDPRRRGALLEAEAAWLTLNEAPSSEQQPSAELTRSPIKGLFERRQVVLGGSAALAASLAAGFLWVAAGTSYTTELGEVRRVPLADGSIATVNTSSRIEVKLAADRRHVRITRGEAWFQVAKDPSRPFVVEAGRIRVQAVGTAFSVGRVDGGARILVTEGVVEAWAADADGHKVRLIAGQSAFVGDNAAIRVDATAPSSVDRALAWRAGLIDLSGQTLAEAVGEFNRYNRRKLVLADQRLGGEQFDGVFQLSDPEGFAIAVRDSLSTPVDVGDPARIVIGRTAE
jgi:transmembrane sensor